MTLGHEVAVVGYAARLPGAGSVKAFWSLLQENHSAVGWITPDRFPTGAFYHPSPQEAGRSYTFAAGLIDDVWGFDASAFGMSPREAEQVDPQQRHLLEVTQDALAHAGIPASSLAGTTAGVYVGASSVDYGARFFADPASADVHMMTGNTLSIIANRLSYHLDLHGPSFTVDTACSSSLVALSLAADAILAGKIDTAIVGGVNLLLSPFSFVGFSRASMLSPTGRCRPFDAEADGYVRGEGALVLVLRSTEAAHRARNRIHGTLVGWGVGQDGRTTGLSLPSAESQRHLLEQVYQDFGLDPCELAFVEAHGTGTKVGDPVEADALGKALAQHRAQPLPIGSVKSNIGHLEPASGLAGVLKTLLALKHGSVPATLHQKSPNPDIPFDDLNLRVIDRNRPLPERRGPAMAGVNSFGFGGTNAHVVMRGEDRTIAVAHLRGEVSPPPLFLSAHAPEILPAVAERLLEAWPADRRMTADFVAATAHQRDALPHRVLIHGATPDALRHHVEAFAAGEVHPTILTGQAVGQDAPVTFVFSGNGSQWAGMGRAAWESNPSFREALEEIDALFIERLEMSLVELMFSDAIASDLRHATYAQPLLLALQMATVRTLEMSGLTSQAVLGHSVGEIAAAWCAGALSSEQAVEVVVARSRHQEVVRGHGTMAALMLGEREARHFLASTGTERVDIAAINSWRSVTVSGPAEGIDAVLDTAKRERIGGRRLDLDYPFHSQLIDPVQRPLMRDLDGLRPRSTRKRFISSVTGAKATGESLGAEYWWRNVREPVQFDMGLRCLVNEGFRLFVEVGPRPILASYMRDTLRDCDVRGTIIETLDESNERDRGDALERTVGRVAIAGGHLDRQRLFGPPPVQTVPLPAYPWRHSVYRVKPTTEALGVFRTARNPLLGVQPRQDIWEWLSTIDSVLFPWLKDHVVGGLAVFPAAGFVEVLMAAAREIYGEGALELRELDIVRPLAFDGTTTFETRVRVASETGIAEFLSRPRNAGIDWSLHARCIVGRSPLAKGPIGEIGPSGRIIVPKAKVYDAASHLGFTYGEAFQRIRHVSFPHPKRAIAVLAGTPGVSVSDQTIDITALDAAFHALFATEEAGVADMPMKRMLPVRFARVRSFAPGSIAHHAIARTLRQSAGSIVTDIELIDEGGRLILTAETVRLVEAPVAQPINPRSLVYRRRRVELDRSGSASVVVVGHSSLRQGTALIQAEALEESQLLLEAGCLRAAWEAFHPTSAKSSGRRQDVRDSADISWTDYLCASLLWQLDTKGFLDSNRVELAQVDSCPLPTISAVIRTLIARHPTMAAEAAALARIGETLGPLLGGNPATSVEGDVSHWRPIEAASQQIAQLRLVLLNTLQTVIAGHSADRFVRVLVIGADHARAVVDALEQFPHVEVCLSDLDGDRLEQAQATLGDHAHRLRFQQWSQLDSGGGSFDLAVAVDALSEMALAGGGLQALKKLLRPQGTLIAAELAPSVFWDIVRGMRPGWWERSAHVDFPVGPLLSAPEWTNELETVGFLDVETHPMSAGTGVGILLHARKGAEASASASQRLEMARFRWEGTPSPISSDLQKVFTSHSAPHGGDQTGTAGEPSDQPVAWVVEADDVDAITSSSLTDTLARLAGRISALAISPAPFWVLVVARERDASLENHPIWCAVTAAMRVAQNEYPAVEIRCLGLGDSEPATLFEAACELAAPDVEREILFQGGRRYVFRLENGIYPGEQPADHSDSAFQLSSRAGTSRGALVWARKERKTPGPEEVEIEVAATGLNFRDVMWNLGLLPEEALEEGYAGATLGMECSGTISAVGTAVTHLTVGDRVVAFVSGGFASHLVTPAFAVGPLPHGFTFEGGASLPVAYLTAYYALVHMAGLKRGEIVLVHGGAGAVGLAALNIARMVGARIIATAGSHDKRALLRRLGAEAVLNSRTLGFADEVRALTGGKGVDIVLNSLAGEAMARSMDCLRPFGRFIELGKRDFYANTHMGLRPFRRNLSYFGVDVDQLLSEHRELTDRLFRELTQLFADGKLPVLPYCVFPGERVDEAFRLMQRSGHYGKIVVTPPARPTELPNTFGHFPVDAAGVHLVVGGTSGFGLATAEWLVARGATHIVLAGRSALLKPEAQNRVNRLRRNGVTADIVGADVRDAAAVGTMLRDLAARGPLKGVVHAAMVLDDRLIDGMDRGAIDCVVQPKVTGALNLAQATSDMALDYILLFSSATTLLGNPGQYNYVAANAFLEGLACRLQEAGRPCLAVAWGAIEDTGYLARHMATNTSLRKRFSSSLLPAKTSLDVLDLACDAAGNIAIATLAIGRIDWAMVRRDLAIANSPCFAGVIPATDMRSNASSAIDLERLRALPVDEASDLLLEVVVEEIASVLRLSPKEVDRHRPLAEIGMDSLMMLELRSTVEETLQVELPLMSLANGITPVDVSRRIAALITGDGLKTVLKGGLAAMSSSHLTEDVEAMDPSQRETAALVVLERARRIDGPL